MKLVFCTGTAPRTPLPERARAAAAAGFDAISLWADDVENAHKAGFTDGDLRALFAELGLSIGELDGVTRWLPETGGAGFGRKADDFFAIHAALGGRSLNVMHLFGAPIAPDVGAQAFAALCDQAREHDLLVHLEFLPWAGVPSLEAAWEIVQRADRDNGGLMLDTWHFIRSGGVPEALRKVPGDKIFAVQLADAPAAPEGAIFDETLRKRRPPGEGDGQLVELVRTLDAIGCTAPLGVEVFSERLGALPVEDIAARAMAATTAVLSAARGAEP
jgi:sugar phosphate isomerase/epimerase